MLSKKSRNILLLACVFLGASGALGREIIEDEEVAPLVTSQAPEGYTPLTPVVVDNSAAEEMLEWMTREIQARTHEEQARIARKVQAERAEADAASRAHDVAMQKLTTDHSTLELAKKAVDDAGALVDETGSDKRVATQIMERREIELQHLRAEAAAHERKLAGVKANYDEATAAFKIAQEHYDQRVNTAAELRASAIQMQSEVYAHRHDKRLAFEAQRFEIQNIAEARISQLEEQAQVSINRIRADVERIAEEMAADEKAVVADRNKAIAPLLTQYQTTVHSIEEKFLRDMDDLNQERLRHLSQKMADTQRHGLSLEKIQEIANLANQRMEVLNEAITLKTVSVAGEKQQAFDYYIARKTQVIVKYSAAIEAAKRAARDRMDAKWVDIEQIKKDLRVTVAEQEAKTEETVKHSESVLGQGSDVEDRNVQVAMSKADLAYQAALAHLPEVQAAHAHLMESERLYRQAFMHKYEGRLLAKKNEIDEARQHATVAADKEREAIIGVRHAQARVDELTRSIHHDEQLAKKYSEAADLHDHRAITLADTPIEHIVKEQVTEEWKVRAAHTERATNAHRAALKSAQEAMVRAGMAAIPE